MGDQRMTNSLRKKSAGGTSEAADAALDVMLTDAAGGGRARLSVPEPLSASPRTSRADPIGRRAGWGSGRGVGLCRERAIGCPPGEARPALRRLGVELELVVQALLQTHLAVGERWTA